MATVDDLLAAARKAAEAQRQAREAAQAVSASINPQKTGQGQPGAAGGQSGGSAV